MEDQDKLRQYQKPTDTKILDAINKLTYAREQDRAFDDGTFVEALDTALACMRQMEIDLYPKAGLDHDADDWGNGYSRGYADGLQALRQMGSTEPDCSTAEWQGGKCLGYGRSDTDDEPCEVCKACPKQASYVDEPCEWCDKTLTLFTHSGKFIPENQPPRSFCSACGRMVK